MNTVILGSGSGTNCKAILESEKSGQLGSAKVVGIISDHEDAIILKHARTMGKQNEFISCSPFKTKLDGIAEDIWIDKIKRYQPDLIVLAGFMRVLKPKFIEAFRGKIINLHPSLLPSFSGLNGIQKAYKYGVKITGCTVHWVEIEVDAGKIIAQSAVDTEGLSLNELESAIHRAEHKLLPKVIKNLSALL